MEKCLAVVLAGGKGARLEPLTRNRAKPAVPFGGAYRIVDFVLSNCLNSGFHRIVLLTQYKALSLERHIDQAWRRYFCRALGEFIDVIPPQQRIDEQWYQGTADAVYQNIYSIERERPQYVVILAGDHIYKMNYRRMVEYHEQTRADLTIAALTVSPEAAREFGVMEVDENSRVVGFEEKPPEPKTIPGNDDRCLASMGIYVFNTKELFEQLCEDAAKPHSNRDFGRNVIPGMISNRRVHAFPFRDENRKQDAYWRDVGTLDAYYEANMELISVNPLLNLYDEAWPIRSHQPNFPPPKFVFSGQEDPDRVGRAVDSMVGQGSIISGALAEHSIIGRNVRVNSYAKVSDSILFDGVDIGRGAVVHRAIIDKSAHVPAGIEVGVDLAADRARGLHVTDSGIVVISVNEELSDAVVIPTAPAPAPAAD